MISRVSCILVADVILLEMEHSYYLMLVRTKSFPRDSLGLDYRYPCQMNVQAATRDR